MIRVLRLGAALGVALALAAPTTDGPYDIPLFNTPKSETAKGHARLVFAHSPFGVAVTADGRASYDVIIDASGLPAPASLGPYTTYVAWAASTDLKQWDRLGEVRNGTSTVGHAELNKFLLVITAEPTATPRAHTGPTVLHGTSPSDGFSLFSRTRCSAECRRDLGRAIGA